MKKKIMVEELIDFMEEEINDNHYEIYYGIDKKTMEIILKDIKKTVKILEEDE